MKTIHFLTTTLLLTCVCLACKCEKYEEPPVEMPPETQEGKNTFGCYLDGELYTSYKLARSGYGAAGYSASLEAAYSYNNISGTLGIICYCRSGHEANSSGKSFFAMFLENPEENVEMILDEAWVSKHLSANLSFRFRNNTNGKVILTRFDTINRIVSGRFSYEASLLDSYPGIDSIARVTDGRFDLKLQTISFN
jgi:hypothetical protein